MIVNYDVETSPVHATMEDSFRKMENFAKVNEM